MVKDKLDNNVAGSESSLEFDFDKKPEEIATAIAETIDPDEVQGIINMGVSKGKYNRMIMKRDNSEVPFDPGKIRSAIEKANMSRPESQRISNYLISAIVEEVSEDICAVPITVSVEDVSDVIEQKLIRYGAGPVVKAFIEYRSKHATKRQEMAEVDSLLDMRNEVIIQENSNKNPFLQSTIRDYIAGIICKMKTKEILPEEVWAAHMSGLIHFHDADYFPQRMFNCCLINLEDMLQNGTCISKVLIEKPHSFRTACTIATQIVAQVASNQYGGQTITMAHLAPFVDVSRQAYIKKEVEKLHRHYESLREKGFSIPEISEDIIMEEAAVAAEEMVAEEISAGIQTIQYQVITLMTTNGQAPFLTVNLNINEAKNDREKADLALCIAEMLRQRTRGVKNEQGQWVAAAFPKLIYVMDENNIYEGSEYFELTKLAAKCIAAKMVPDPVSAKKMRELKVGKSGKGNVYPPMGCRSFLTPDRTVGNVANALNYVEGEEKYYGRFNQGVVTLNLLEVALRSEGNMDKFWKVLDESLQICHTGLRYRHERLLGTVSDASPIHWQYGAIARLKKGEKIDRLLYGGYSTLSLGYAALYECTKYMTGKSHTDDDAKPFALAVMQKLNDACAEWKQAEDIDYSVYGTPLESTTYKFATSTKKNHGVIKGVNDKDYVTNSYHVHVTEQIDAFTKLKFESEFQELSPGGAISYVEIPDLRGNLQAIISIMQYMYENIMYAEMNTKSDFCQCCGYNGEIKIVLNDKGKRIWRCPNCGNTDQSKMNVARRTCGYIGTEFWNQGRTQEIQDRVMHV